MKSKYLIFWCVASLLLLLAVNLNGDSWYGPTKMKFQSPNNKYLFVTKPAINFFFINIRKCKGSLYQIENNKKKKIWSKNLVNEISPYNSIVHNNGLYVVTFDDYGHLGYGENVVVIYNNSGILIKKLYLWDIVQADDSCKLISSFSSIWWLKNSAIDESNEALLLEIPLQNTEYRRVESYKYVILDLKSGDIIFEFYNNTHLSEEEVMKRLNNKLGK